MTVEEGVRLTSLPVIPFQWGCWACFPCHTVKTALDVRYGAYSTHQLCSRACPLCAPHRDAPSSALSTPVPQELDQRWPHLQADFIPLGWSDATLCPLWLTRPFRILSLWKMNGELCGISLLEQDKKEKEGRQRGLETQLSLSGNADPTTDRHTGQLPDGGKQQMDPGWLKQERDLWKG